MYKKGFTLIELLVTITIIAVLSSVVLFSVTQYINRSKDANISANLAILVPAGEVYYSANGSSGYNDFCNPTRDFIKNAINEIPLRSDGEIVCGNSKGFCCGVDVLNQSWATCVQLFTDGNTAFCVDSRGIKKIICNTDCTSTITKCPDTTTCTP